VINEEELKYFYNMSLFIAVNEITDTKATLMSYVEFLEAISRAAEKLSYRF